MNNLDIGDLGELSFAQKYYHLGRVNNDLVRRRSLSRGPGRVRGRTFHPARQTTQHVSVFKCSTMDSSGIGGPRYQLSGSRFDPIRVRVTKILSDLVKIRKIRIWSLICVRVWTRDSVFKVWLHPPSLALHRINFQDQNRTICVDSRPRFCFPKIRSIYVSHIVSDMEYRIISVSYHKIPYLMDTYRILSDKIRYFQSNIRYFRIRSCFTAVST